MSSMADSTPAARPVPGASPEPRRRGVFLTLWLGFMTLAAGGGAFLNYQAYRDLVDHADPRPSWPFLAMIALAAPVLAGLGAIWAWRSWGFYLLWGATAAILVVNLVAGAPLLLALAGLVGPFILTLIASGRAHLFDA